MLVSAAVADRRRINRFAGFLAPDVQATVLDITPGSDLLARALAPRVRSVVRLVGADSCEAQAPRISQEQGDPLKLPFPDETFALVTCGPSFHHLASPQRVVSEMERVCRLGGRVGLEDIVGSEQEVRARYQNRLEKLRDRSHPGYLRLSDLISIFGHSGLTVRRVETLELLREFNEWLSGARPSPRRVELILRLLSGAQEADLSGLGIRISDDTVEFSQHLAWICAEKPQ